MSEPKKLFLIDVMPLLYRGHFVFLKTPRMTSTGINTSALTGFANTLLQILNEQEPTHVALVLDSETPTFRHERYPLYKAQRQKMPEDLAASIPMAIELAEALRLPILRVNGFEADDVMGTLAARAAEQPGWTTYLATPDKDVAQLVGPSTYLFRPGKASAPAEIYDVEAVCSHWNLASPAQMIDYSVWPAMPGQHSWHSGRGDKTATACSRSMVTWRPFSQTPPNSKANCPNESRPAPRARVRAVM